MNPTVSIIVPVYNCEPWLGECIDSLLSQSYRDFELLLVDNNSTDRSPDIMRSYEDERVRILACAEQGVSSARNAGLLEAKGTYIYFIDGDDVLFPGALERMVTAAIQHNADVVVHNMQRSGNGYDCPFDPVGRDVCARGEDIPHLVEEKFHTFAMHHACKLYRLALLLENDIKYEPGLSPGEDLIVNLAVYERSNCVYYIGEPLYDYRMRPGGLNTKHRDNLIDIKLRLQQETSRYFLAHGLDDTGARQVAFVDILSYLLNEREQSGIKRVLNLESNAYALTKRTFWGLSLKHKLMFVLIKLRLSIPIMWAVKYMRNS